MALTVEQQIKGLADTISSAQLHFDVWRALELSQVDPKNVDVLNTYFEFFYASIPASFESCVVSCYQLLETKDDRISFPSLRKELKTKEGLDVCSDARLVALETGMKPTWQRISTLRNNYIGHLSKKETAEKVFRDAGLDDRLMEKFISAAKELHRGITYLRDRSIDGFNVRGTAAVDRLLAVLRDNLTSDGGSDGSEGAR
jgi:hypothetical protein